MEYECRVVSASSIEATFNKVVSPLCSRCINRTCTNPISEKKMSVFGKVHTTRLYQMGTAFFMVVECDGFFCKDNEE